MQSVRFKIVVKRHLSGSDIFLVGLSIVSVVSLDKMVSQLSVLYQKTYFIWILRCLYGAYVDEFKMR